MNWLKADKYGVENIANLDKIPPHGRDRDRRRDPVGAGLRRADAGARYVLSAATTSSTGPRTIV